MFFFNFLSPVESPTEKQNFESPTHHPFITRQMPFICTADWQCSHQIGAALYTTLCSTTATVPAPPHWCCTLYNSLQYYSYCTCPTILLLLSIQLSAVIQPLYLPHQTGVALYTTVCSTTATVPAPPLWCCSLYNSLQY